MANHLFDALMAAGAAADKPFLRLEDGASVTYGGLVALSGQIANALVQLGVRPGDRVAVQVEKTPEALITYLGCVRAGAVFLPLNTAYTPAEVDYFLADAEPVLCLCDPAAEAALRPSATRIGARLETLDAAGQGSFRSLLDAQSPAFVDVARGPDDLAAILYTSGTTGRSKGAMLTHDNLASNARTLVAAWRFTADDVLLHALPIFHTHGLFVATNTLLMAGGSMLFLPKFDLAALLALLPQATTLMGVPTFYSRLLSAPDFTRAAAAHMRLFISGSAPLSAEVHREFRARTGHAILERYGMTETNMNTSNPHDGDRRAGTVGLPLPGVSLRIADPDTGRELPQGEIGIIEVKGPNVFSGYWRMPEKTAQEFRADGFFITGDMGQVSADGYVSIVGRAKDLVISGGFNIYPAEVEGLIDELPGVAESAVIGVPHADLGEAVVAVVAPKPGAVLDEAALRAALDGRLARFKQPRRVIILPALPRNTMGKIQKAALRETYRDLLA
ncbi:AMP-binding protein [Microvirga tunisiensis]|uniref:AMP-binding protein n=1 Tax=Pannonibacter tanglangensis TaxID=2750084 RepID=A0A7X5F2K7_9HYPH|nr:malonyl-CoA synthase [Pannonibacter sp. XCT-53]NBN78606.1 AMP-binding protein [Pannonibacter sp. XCT-53]